MLSHLSCTASLQNSEVFSGANPKSGLKVVICCETRHVSQSDIPDTARQTMETEKKKNSHCGANPVTSPANSYSIFFHFCHRGSTSKAMMIRRREVSTIHQFDFIFSNTLPFHVRRRCPPRFGCQSSSFSLSRDSSTSVEEPLWLLPE